MSKKLIILCLGAVALLLPSIAGAAVNGPCVNCHTMHASQDGTTTATNDQLLKGAGCTGCHAITGVVNDNTGLASTGTILAPQVDDQTNTNAAGYFTMTDGAAVDAQQHNVADIAGMTGDGALALTGAPGGGSLTTTDAGSPALTCSGCHSNPVHHNVTVGTYRGLGEIFNAQQIDVAGYGNNLNSSGTTIGGIGGTSQIQYDSAAMNLVCAGCHPNFHTGFQVGSVAGLWIRHPTDVQVSVASGPSVQTVTVATDTDPVTVGRTAAINGVVMCISCHASHGSPYNDLLKYDYALATAGGGTVGIGCETCHSYGAGM